MGCEPGRIAKSMVLVADGEPVVCVVAAAHSIDPDLVCEALDCAHVEPAAADAVRAATGFAAGSVPPVGHGLRLLIDESLLDGGPVWTHCGDGASAIELDPRELAARSDAEVVPLRK